MTRRLRREVRDEVLEAKEIKRQEKNRNRVKVATQARAWCHANLKPGMYIKAVGTRDGKGIRKVIDVDFERESVTCRQIQGFWNNQQKFNDEGPIIIKELPYITEHLFTKVRGEVEPRITQESGRRWKKINWDFVDYALDD